MNARLEKILNLPLYQRIVILVGLLVVVVGSFVWFLYLPKSEELEGLRQQSAQLEAKLQDDRRIARDLPKFKAEYEKMKEQLTLALTELPNETEIPGLLTSIASLARDNGLDVVRFKPGAEVPKGFYADVPVELKLVGSYHNAALFFNAVANLSRIVNIHDLTLGNAKAADGRTILSVDCQAMTFRFIEEAKGQ